MNESSSCPKKDADIPEEVEPAKTLYHRDTEIVHASKMQRLKMLDPSNLGRNDIHPGTEKILALCHKVT